MPEIITPPRSVEEANELINSIRVQPLNYLVIDTFFAELNSREESFVWFSAHRLLCAGRFLDADLARYKRGETRPPELEELVVRAEDWCDTMLDVLNPFALERWRNSEDLWHQESYSTLERELYRRCIMAEDTAELHRAYTSLNEYFPLTKYHLSQINDERASIYRRNTLGPQ